MHALFCPQACTGAPWPLKYFGPNSPAVHLYCDQSCTRAKYAITVVDQAAEAPRHKRTEDTDIFARTWGWAKFMSHDALRAYPGYLAGDRLLLRARVEVLP